MLLDDDKEFLNNPDYNLPLEKFYMAQFSEHPENYYAINDNSNGTISRAYPFSNEDLKRYFSKRDLSGKSVLTVGSSGDQLLNSILSGAKHVTVMDGNIYARPYIEYKLAAMQTMDYKEFKENFFKGKAFDWKVYQRISHLVSDESKGFWDSLFTGVDCGDKDAMYLNYALLNKDTKDGQIRSMFYVDASVYKRLQKLIPTCVVDYKVSSFEDFPSSVQGERYDLIYLSNVRKYIPDETYRDVVYNLYDNNLNSGGEMVVNYTFKHDFFTLYPPTPLEEVLTKVEVIETPLKGDTIYSVKKPLEQQPLQDAQAITSWQQNLGLFLHKGCVYDITQELEP